MCLSLSLCAVKLKIAKAGCYEDGTPKENDGREGVTSSEFGSSGGNSFGWHIKEKQWDIKEKWSEVHCLKPAVPLSEVKDIDIAV